MSVNNRTLLIERSKPLNYIQESGERNGKRYIGRLAGPAADLKKPTRNDRWYQALLWKNVMSSESFKEGMETLTIFGEVDHPEDRVDSYLMKAAIVLTKMEIREDEGIVYAEFDILDTPSGRILKSILDYGSQIGVSSRGIGDEIQQDGQTIIDPDTYEFYAFDAVTTPAVKSARPSVVESKDTKKTRALKESLESEIKSTKSVSELNSIKDIVSSCNLPDLDSIMESIDIRKSELGDDISSTEELEKLRAENARLKKKVEGLSSKVSANNIRIKNLTERLHVTNDQANELSGLLRESRSKVANLSQSIVDGVEQIEDYERIVKRSDRKIRDLTSKNESITRKYATLESDYNDLLSERDTLIEKHDGYARNMSSKISKYESRITKLESQLNNEKKSSAILESNNRSTKESLSRQLRSMKTEASKVKRYASRANDEYLKLKCSSYGIQVSVVESRLPNPYTIDDIDKVVNEIADRARRFNKVPVFIQPRKAIVKESIGSISPEDAQTMAFLKDAMNNN